MSVVSIRLLSALFRVALGLAFLAGSAIVPAAAQAGQKGPSMRVSSQDREPRQLLVKFRADAPPRMAEDAVRVAGATDVKAFKRPRKLGASPMDRWRLLTFGPGVDLGKVRERLLKNPHIELAEYDYKVSIDLTPNDPMYPQLWGLNNTGQTGGKPDADIDAPEAWDLQTGSASVVVAVIDTGVAYDHPDLAANIWINPGEIPANGIDDDGNGYVDDVYGYDFSNFDSNPYDDHGHGTHVSGTIAGVGNNGIGVVGVSWYARIMGVKFLNSAGSGSTSGAISAVLYAADMGAKVMNNSWGGGGFSQALNDAIVTADQAGALFVAAAGNAGSNNDLTPNYPSNYEVPNVLAVAATDHSDLKASFSNYGVTTVDLGAPGVNILSTVPTAGNSCCSDPSGYKLLSGTSMATPHVSGAAALLVAHYPGISSHQVKDRLMTSAEPVPSMQGITVTGGRLNIFNGFEDDTTPPAAVSDLAVVNVGGTSATLGWVASGDDGSSGRANSYDLRYSTAPIDESNFGSATPVGSVPVTGPAGTIEVYTVKGLNPETQYFFALKVADNVGNSSALSNIVTATTKAVAVVFRDDFESTSSNWTVAGSDGAGGAALWHISGHRYASPSNAMYYGKESTLTFNTGARNYGSITSAPINLLGATDSLLSFRHFLATENLSPYDTARVQVSADSGASWTDLFVTALNTGGMTEKTVSLAAYDGKSIQLRFAFDTVDSIANDYEGWVVDDVTILAADLEKDTVPPAAVTDLAVQTPGTRSAVLSWTAPGDDGNVGLASAYDLRYSTAPIDPANPDAGTPVAGMPKPKPAGSPESFEVTGLSPGTTYYFVLRAIDNMGNAAPASNIASGQTLPLIVAFSDGFETGGGSWTVTGTDGVGGPALWHVSPHRYASPSNAMYYGKESTLTYNTAAHNYGSITSPSIGLKNMQSATLSFSHFLQTENLAPYDSARVQISNDNGVTWKDLYVTSIGTAGKMVALKYDLAGYLGKVVRLRFSFDTVDGALNDYEGWVLDDVTIEGPPLPPTPPVANAGGPYAGFLGKPVQLDGSGSYDANGDALTYAWDFGDGSPIGTGVAPTHVYAAKGDYVATLVVNDGEFDSSPSTTTVSITNQAPVANAGGPYTTTRNKLVTFDSSKSGDPDGDALEFVWAFGDGSTGAGPSPQHAYANAGTYTVTLTVSDGAATATAKTTVAVTNLAPTANNGGPYSVQKNKPLTLNGTGSSDPDGDPLTYQWDFGDGSTGTGSQPVHSYARSGLYVVKLTVSDGALSASANTTVTVTNQAPVASFTGPSLVYKNDTVVFDGSASSDADGDPLTYRWTLGSTQQPPTTNPIATTSFAYTATFSVTLTVGDGEVVSAPFTRLITVQSRPPIANAGPDQTVEQRTTVYLSASGSSDPDGVIANVAWRQVSGTAVTLTGTDAQSVSFVAPQVKDAGTLSLVFEVEVTDSDGVTATDQVTVTVMKRL